MNPNYDIYEKRSKKNRESNRSNRSKVNVEQTLFQFTF